MMSLKVLIHFEEDDQAKLKFWMQKDIVEKIEISKGFKNIPFLPPLSMRSAVSLQNMLLFLYIMFKNPIS